MEGYKEGQGSIDRETLLELLCECYGLAAGSLEYVAAGECSQGYIAASDQGRLFVKIHQRGPGGKVWIPSELEAKLAAVASLRAIPGVVAPLATHDGRYVLPSPDGPIAMFPYIPGGWTDPATPSQDDIERAARLLAGIHACPGNTVLAHLQPFGDSLDVPYAGGLRTLMTMIDARNGVAISDPIHSLLRRHRGEILTALENLEALAARIRQGGVDLAVTHGDPNHANLLRTADGSLHLVDWDDIALGPVERDLVFFSGPQFPSFWRAYAATGAALSIHEDVLVFYLLLWDLQEITDYGTRLVQGGLTSSETDRAWRELTQYLPLRPDRIRASARAMATASSGVHENQRGGRHARRPRP